MGLFDLFKKKKPPSPEPIEQEHEQEQEVAAVVVLRAGMNTPDEAFAAAVLEERYPAGLGLPRFRLCQPRWFKPELVESGMRTLATALADETGTRPEAATWILCAGPGGAPAAIVLLRR